MGLEIRFVEDVTDTLTAVAGGQGEIVDEIEDRVFEDRLLRETEDLAVCAACWRACGATSAPTALSDVDRFDLPNLARVFRNGAVA